jgi:DNA-binding GntR family transcriptional regulator
VNGQENCINVVKLIVFNPEAAILTDSSAPPMQCSDVEAGKIMDSATRSGLTLQRRKNLAEQISDTLVEAIGLGVLKPSERIVEADIASRFKVSRVPVREALKILVTQGILEGEPHKGLHVIAIDDTMIDRICEARLAVEIIAVKTLMATPELVTQLNESLDQRIADMAKQVSRNDLTGVNQADIAFHTDICLISNNRIVWTLWQAIARHVWIVFGREILSEKAMSNIVQEHEELRTAILSGKQERAVHALQEHIFRQRMNRGPLHSAE